MNLFDFSLNVTHQLPAIVQEESDKGRAQFRLSTTREALFCCCFKPCADVSYLGRDSVKVLAQHSPHVFASVRRHLVLEQEGEVAALADAVEVAVDLVVLTPCEKRMGVNDPVADSFIFGEGWAGGGAQHEPFFSARRVYKTHWVFCFFFSFIYKAGTKAGSGFWVF